MIIIVMTNIRSAQMGRKVFIWFDELAEHLIDNIKNDQFQHHVGAELRADILIQKFVGTHLFIARSIIAVKH